MTTPERVAVVVPYLGNATHDCTVLGWHKQIGDSIDVGEVLCEIATDKVDTEVESTSSGFVLELAAAEGDTVNVGEPLAWLGSSPAVAESEPSSVTVIATTDQPGGSKSVSIGSATIRIPTNGDTLASPFARRTASDRGVELSTVTGTGAHGRIRAADVPDGAVVESNPVSQPEPEPRHEPLPLTVPPPGRVVAVSGVRRATAEHMVRSVRIAPHASVDIEVHMHLVAAAMHTMNDDRVRRGLPAVSYLPFIAHAAVAALRRHPGLNASYRDDEIIEWDVVNLGIAVDTPRGLLVPVVADADTLMPEALANRIGALATAAREGTLRPQDTMNGTFTISSLGGLGVTGIGPILHQPQAAILGVPAVHKRVVVVEDNLGTDVIGIRPTTELSLTFDHRAVDGAQAARYLADVRNQLEGMTN